MLLAKDDRLKDFEKTNNEMVERNVLEHRRSNTVIYRNVKNCLPV
jgi:hypothetical protein